MEERKAVSTDAGERGRTSAARRRCQDFNSTTGAVSAGGAGREKSGYFLKSGNISAAGMDGNIFGCMFSAVRKNFTGTVSASGKKSRHDRAGIGGDLDGNSFFPGRTDAALCGDDRALSAVHKRSHDFL